MVVVLIVLAARYVLRVTRLFFSAVREGTIKLARFDPEWADSTYKLARVLIIAFAVVVSYPYILGSQSPAFKGVTIFLGVLFSIGSSSFLANVIAGYTMTYRRAFRVGDRIKVGEMEGDVTEVQLLVTRLRSIKNEEFVLPNSVILTRMLDENEFLSPYGIRSLSKYHRDHPYVINVGGQEHRVEYLPAESNTGMFGGNSNWRGPVWLPVNALIIRSLVSFFSYYGDNFKIECPTGSGRTMNLFEVASEISERLAKIFLRDEHGHWPVYGGAEKFQSDPYWRDYVLFYEYFHGDNGAGIGASHQTGWTGLVGALFNFFGRMDPAAMLAGGRAAQFRGSA